MESSEVIETLLFNLPEIRKPFISLGVISRNRTYSSIDRPEYRSYISPFTSNAKIIGVYSTMNTVFIIERDKDIAKFNVIKIKGPYTEIQTMSKTMLTNELVDALFIKEYLPQPFQNKIVVIDKFDSQHVYGAVFSEFLKNEWTLEDPYDLNNTATIPKYSSRSLLKSLVLSIWEEQDPNKEQE